MAILDYDGFVGIWEKLRGISDFNAKLAIKQISINVSVKP